MEQRLDGPAPDDGTRAPALDPASPGKRTLTSGHARGPSVDAIARAVVQRLLHGGEDPAMALDAGDAQAIAATGFTGSAAAPPHLAAVQRSFGRHDVSGVRAYVGGPAASAAASLGAAAYASGDQVAFADSPDLFLVAHELAHVVQQRGGVQLKGGVGAAGDAYERHADAVAAAVVRGDSAEALLDSMAGAGAGPVVRRTDRALLAMSSEDLVARARELDAALAGAEEPQRRQNARTLIEIYGILQDRVARGEYRPGAGSGSPLAGMLDDVAPFGNLDMWHTIAGADVPRSPRRRRPDPTPTPEPTPTPTPTPSIEPGHRDHTIETRDGEHIAESLETGAERIDMIDGAMGIADFILEITHVGSGLMGIGSVVTALISYSLNIAAEHERELRRCRIAGLQIGAVGLEAISRGDYDRTTVTGRQLLAASAGGRAIRDALILHTPELPDAAVDQEILDTITHLASGISEDMQQRITLLLARHPDQRAAIEAALPRIRGEYLRAVQAELATQVAAEME
jgi:hypothetical protein